jgi:hypothetical protein
MTSEAPLDLSMDALDLSKKRRPESPEGEKEIVNRRAPNPGAVQQQATHLGVDLGLPAFYNPPAGFSYPAFLPPYFLPPAALLFQNPEFSQVKERLQKELIRNLGLAQLADKAAPGPNSQESVPKAAPKAPDSPQNPSSSVKMVIKNGVLVPKQKQRRYRTERPFGCEHCTAR